MNQEENNYSFQLWLGNNLITERIFSGDVYNPFVRYRLDVRDMVPEIIDLLRSALSLRQPTTKHHGYNLVKEFETVFKASGVALSDVKNNKLAKASVPYEDLYKEKGINRRFNAEVETNVFSFAIYMNSGKIIERDFFVDFYNPETRFSLELKDAVQEITQIIEHHLKVEDRKAQWEDFDLVNKFGFDQHRLRSMPWEERDKIVGKILYNRK